ncbi:ATP-binding protein [Marinomonas sp. 2405UD68-3]|uniref:ATP-binding protein n=1 Tax=Marinomonas sp. 2405UD68-3 TaxID=3391835 RepID=UPI0039C96513
MLQCKRLMMVLSKRKEFPFSAVAGQEQFKLALILSAVNPLIGGVLVSGPRGSAKSTLARGVAGILPKDSVLKDALSQDPLLEDYTDQSPAFVTLPLGASEERLLGTLDLQQVLQDKHVAFHPGLLSKAHGGVLYVDEVNLLADNLVDQLLDVAASGVNRVERDGISHEHDAKFLLIGTMNPDEGELRPQLQDRFGLMVQLTNHYTLEERIQIVQLREKFDNNPSEFCDAFRFKQKNLKQSIQVARTQLSKVICQDQMRMEIAQRCHLANVDGVRADIVWIRAAMAHCAWRGSLEVNLQDIEKVEELVLSHRRQAPPPSANNSRNNEPKKNTPNKRPPESRQPPSSQISQKSTDSSHELPSNLKGESLDNNQNGENDNTQNEGDWGSMSPHSFESERVSLSSIDFIKNSKPPVNKPSRSSFLNEKQFAGKNQGMASAGQKPTANYHGKAIDWFATLIKNSHEWPPKKMQYQPRKLGKAMLHFILLDTSASTVGQAFLNRGKEAILSIAQQAYLRREHIAILGFGNNQVISLLPRMRAPKDLLKQLQSIQAGGGTPLQEALTKASEQLRQWQYQQPDLQSHVYVVTDGRTSLESLRAELPSPCSVLDTEVTPVKRGRAEQLAQRIGAQYFLLEA